MTRRSDRYPLLLVAARHFDLVGLSTYRLREMQYRGVAVSRF